MPGNDQRNPPPPYSSSTTTAAAAETEGIPASIRQSSSVKHSYSLFDSRNQPWVTLTVDSNVSDPRFLPAYYQGQTISGSVTMMLSKPETVYELCLNLSGTITAANTPVAFTFWRISRELIRRSDTDVPDDSGVRQPPSSSTGKVKLSGEHSWSFDVELPSSCTLSVRTKNAPISFPLPPSFSEKGAAQFINYDITVSIRKGPLRIESRYVLNRLNCVPLLMASVLMIVIEMISNHYYQTRNSIWLRSAYSVPTTFAFEGACLSE